MSKVKPLIVGVQDASYQFDVVASEHATARACAQGRDVAVHALHEGEAAFLVRRMHHARARALLALER